MTSPPTPTAAQAEKPKTGSMADIIAESLIDYYQNFYRKPTPRAARGIG